MKDVRLLRIIDSDDLSLDDVSSAWLIASIKTVLKNDIIEPSSDLVSDGSDL